MRKKSILIMVIAAVLVGSIAAVTVSYISKNSTRTNTFAEATINPVINETFDNVTKEDVYISNTGNSPIYVRVAIVYSLMNASGILLSNNPVANTDYTVSLSSSTNWIQGSDGYYYYKNAVAPNGQTDILIDEIRDITNDVNKRLNVDVIVQGIQADPASAAQSAWGVTVTNGIISLGN